MFAAIVASPSPVVGSGGGGAGEYPIPNAQLLEDALTSLAQGKPVEAVTETLLNALPADGHPPFAFLQVLAGSHARLVECDAPPLFMARRGHLVLLPVIEEEARGRLIRRCDFELRDGDHLALVSEGFIQTSRWDRRFGWRDIAVSIRRLTETRCDAEQLAGALVRLANQRMGESANQRISELATPSTQYPISVLALFVRPMRTATVWSGPPAAAGGKDREGLETLLAEEDLRIICGDTTAEIAARLLGAELVMEPPPEEGWGEVPPVSRMVGRDGVEPVALVTEGLVTMRVARERLAQAKRPHDLAGRNDGASRLARLLLTADKVRFLVGLAVNPSQAERDGTPLRKGVVEKLVEELEKRGKIVAVEYS